MARWDKSGPAIPDWFWAAVETEAVAATTVVEECGVAWRRWRHAGEAGQGAPMLLIHGMNAHSHWWDFIAPQLADEYDVAALDLTGMGDSDYRYSYDAEIYAAEICAVCDAAGFGNDVTVVGHSFGGTMATKAAGLAPERFGALVLVDSGLRHPEEPVPERPLMGGGRAKAYPDRETAEARFRLFPPQPCDNGFILRHIARHSLMRADGGWAWKFDEELPLVLKDGERTAEDYRALSLPTGIIHGALSDLFTPATVAYMRELLPDAPVAEIAGARHHVFLDQPLAFVRELRRMAGELRQRRA